MKHVIDYRAEIDARLKTEKLKKTPSGFEIPKEKLMKIMESY